MGRTNNPYYRPLKDEMKSKNIICSDIAKATGLSLRVIQNWMQKPEKSPREQIIAMGIQQVEFCRQNNKASIYPIHLSKELLTAAKVRLPREQKDQKAKCPRKVNNDVSNPAFGIYSQHLPWKGYAADDQ